MSFTKVMNMATGRLDRELYERHTAWLKAGRKGDGRLLVEGEIIRRMSAAAHNLDGARFEDCNMARSDFNNTHVNSAEFRWCDMSESNLHMAWLQKAKLDACQLDASRLTLVRLDGASVSGCTFDEAALARASLVDGKYAQCSFRKAAMVDIKIANSRFRQCSFQEADFSRHAPLSKLGRADGSIFERCDFRGADFTGLRIDDCTFVDCKFGGAKGRPELGDGIEVRGADLSIHGDGSVLVEGDAFLAQWNTAGRV